jgi:hypothetical protein
MHIIFGFFIAIIAAVTASVELVRDATLSSISERGGADIGVNQVTVNPQDFYAALNGTCPAPHLTLV